MQTSPLLPLRRLHYKKDQPGSVSTTYRHHRPSDGQRSRSLWSHRSSTASRGRKPPEKLESNPQRPVSPGACAPGSPGTVLSIIADAQQEKVYAQTFTVPANRLPAPRAPLSILPFQEWLEALEPDAWISGPGLTAYRDRIPDQIRVIPEDFWYPTPESLLRLGLARLDRGEQDDVWKLEPLYLRPSSAEEKWGNR